MKFLLSFFLFFMMLSTAVSGQENRENQSIHSSDTTSMTGDLMKIRPDTVVSSTELKSNFADSSTAFQPANRMNADTTLKSSTLMKSDDKMNTGDKTKSTASIQISIMKSEADSTELKSAPDQIILSPSMPAFLRPDSLKNKK